MAFFKRINVLAMLLCALAICSVTGCDSGEEASKAGEGYSVESEGGSEKLEKNRKLVRSHLTSNSDSQSVTLLIYMNGSDLESDNGAATADIEEMLEAPYSEDLNIVMQTMGTRKWQDAYGIASDHSQRFLFREDHLELVDDHLPQLDCTDAATLADFINWGTGTYPADRYILLFWNHGGGSVYGFGYDEHQEDDSALTIDEIQLALGTSGVTFDFIGMDCCIMSCLEVCCALYDYCDYMILSEDFESGIGWSYEGWLTALAKDPSIDTVELGETIIDDFLEANENDFFLGDSSTLALIDQSMTKVLYTAWVDFAYANAGTLLDSNYSMKVDKSTRAHPALGTSKLDELAEYYITDIMAVAQNIDSPEAEALSAALDNAIVYYRATEDNSAMTGLSITLPYGDTAFYNQLSQVYTNCGFDQEYITWLGQFTSAQGQNDYYEYDEWEEGWFGWDEYEDDYDWEDWEYWDDDEYWDEEDWGWIDWVYGEYWEEDWLYEDLEEYEDDWWYEDDWDDYCESGSCAVGGTSGSGSGVCCGEDYCCFDCFCEFGDCCYTFYYEPCCDECLCY